jgi:hypothetical protein
MDELIDCVHEEEDGDMEDGGGGVVDDELVDSARGRRVRES